MKKEPKQKVASRQQRRRDRLEERGLMERVCLYPIDRHEELMALLSEWRELKEQQKAEHYESFQK